MNRALFAAITLTLVAGNAAEAQNLLANGSFESPALPDGTSFSTYGAGNGITGWTIGAGSVDLIRDYWNASQGIQSIDLNGNSPASISQLVGTQVGGVYNLSFDLAGNPDGAFDKQLQVYWGGTLVGGTNVTFNQTGSRAAMGWTTINFTGLTATAMSTELRFQGLDTGNPFIGAALDNAAVVTATPEPSTYLLMGTGLLGIVVAARRKRAA